MAERFLTARCDGQLYAMAVGQVAEVVRVPAVARVPQAPRSLLGLANLRGMVIPVASLRGLLGREEKENAATRAIVLDDTTRVAIAVDAVEALVTVDAGQIETRQSELAATPGEILKGTFAVDARSSVAKILDLPALIGAAFVRKDQARARRAIARAALEKTAEVGENSRMLVSFDVAGQEYALALEAVLEVLDAPETLVTLPNSDAPVLGVTPFRDTLLPLLSLRGLLGFPAGNGRGERMKVVVIRVGAALVGLLADHMRTIFPADPDLIEDISPILAARTGGETRISAIYRGDGGRRLVSLLSPERLFRGDIMQRLNAGGGVLPETKESAVQGEQRQFVVFRLGEDEFGLPIEAVDEVAPVPDQIARLPKTPEFLEGIVNLRGEVLPVIDQRRRFDMPAQAEPGRRLIVVRTERHRAGLIVDSVSQVLRCAAADIEPPPSLTNEAMSLVQGVINLEKSARIVLLLDPAELLTRAERVLLDAFKANTERMPS